MCDLRRGKSRNTSYRWTNDTGLGKRETLCPERDLSLHLSKGEISFSERRHVSKIASDVRSTSQRRSIQSSKETTTEIPIKDRRGRISYICRILKDVNDTEDLDVVILSRGGGSTDDLWIFNDEDVVRALFNVRHPVVTGIGHQIDTVLADLTADYAAHTPTAAAQMVVPDIKEIMNDFYESLEQHYFWIQDQVTSTHKQMRSHIQLVTRFSERYLREEKIRARTDFDNLIRVMKTIFERYSSKAEIFASRLLELDPKKPLKRGYALVKKNGSRITKKDQVLPGDILTLIFVDGIRKVMVLNEKEENN